MLAPHVESEEDIKVAMERLECKRKELQDKFTEIEKPSKRVVEKTVQTIKEEKIGNGSGGVAILQENLVITKSKLSKKYMITVRGNIQITQEKNLEYRALETFQLLHSITFPEEIPQLYKEFIPDTDGTGWNSRNNGVFYLSDNDIKTKGIMMDEIYYEITSDKDIDEVIVKILGKFIFGTSGSYEVSDGKIVKFE